MQGLHLVEFAASWTLANGMHSLDLDSADV